MNDIISSNIDKRNNRILDNRDQVEQIIARYYSEKIRIQTLVNVTNAFFSAVKDLSEVFSFSDSYSSATPVDFRFEGKTWTGTVDKQATNYAHTPTRFINVKIPNDSFIYTPVYSTPLFPDDLIENEETNVLRDLLAELVVKWLPDLDWTLIVNYKEQESRLEFYFEDKIKNQTVTIKYEYGTYKYYDENLKRRYPKSEMVKILSNKRQRREHDASKL